MAQPRTPLHDGPPVVAPTVLLVEDDIDHARLVKRWLEAAGLSVVRAESIAEARALVAIRRWDLVVVDVELPDGRGLDLVRDLRADDPLTPVMVATAHGSLEMAREAIRAGVDDLFTKPLVREEVVSKARSLAETTRDHRRRHRRTVLAIGAHPDDVEIAIGGTLIRHGTSGDRVVVLTLTGGEVGGQTSERVAEAQEAARRLGAEVHLRSLPDTAISEGRETISILGEVIREVAADIVYTHNLEDRHQDHRNTHLATMVAAREVPNVLCYQSPSSTTGFVPRLFVPIGDVLDAKLHAMSAYASQCAIRPYMRPSHIRATAEYWGRFSGYVPVEPLEAIRVTDYRVAGDGAAPRRQRRSGRSPSWVAETPPVVAEAGPTPRTAPRSVTPSEAWSTPPE